MFIRRACSSSLSSAHEPAPGPCASEPSAVTHLGTKDSGRHPAHGSAPQADRIHIYGPELRIIPERDPGAAVNDEPHRTGCQSPTGTETLRDLQP